MPWLIIVLGYFLGSIPTAYIAGHILKGVDIRQIGDENMGAANAFLFVPLPLVCWWPGIPGLLVAYSMALSSLVGFTHLLRTRRQVMRQV